VTDRIRVAVVTTTRAEFHILAPLLDELERNKNFSLQLIVSGTHLSKAHGSTINDVRCRFPGLMTIDAQFESSDPEALVNSAARLSTGVATHLRSKTPDLLVVLGDRFELLSVAQAALLLGIPIAHLHGGETTLGAIDDLVRNALTQLASLHLVAADVFAERVLALGAEPNMVHVVGALGVEAVLANRSDDRADALRATGLPEGPYVVLALHPETRGTNTIHDLFESAQVALEHFPDLGVVVTRPNTDVGGDELASLLKTWAEQRPRTVFIDSLGQHFATVVAHAEAIIGNSSSGVIEAPALRTPTVNIGERQDGRPCATSVRSVPADSDAVRAAVEAALQGAVSYGELPYGGEGVSERIVDAILNRFGSA
jgi:UDP-hydrolysing UDP-N-acetyl-D-glucosamine 2-epimerase